MSGINGPIATNVQRDAFGAACRDCLTDVYLVRIERGRPIYRHRERKPPCLFDENGNSRRPR